MSQHPPNYIYLMAAVGSSLNAWSMVETGMGLLFHSVSGIGDLAKSGAIFDAIIAFEARIAVLDAAIEHDKTLTEDEREVWACVSTRLRKLYRKRHEVAHFTVAQANTSEATQIAPFFTWNKANRDSVKYLTMPQIWERTAKFTDASAAVSWFNNLVQHRAMPPPHRPELIAEPPLIAHIRELLARKK